MVERGKVRVSVSGENFAERLQQSLTQALKNSREELRFMMEQESKAKLEQEGAVWLGRLMAAFDHKYEKRGDRLVLVFYNDEDHAPYVEYGAEYGATGPPVAALIPWVRYHLSGWEGPEEYDAPSVDEVPEEDRMVATADGGEVDAFAGVSTEVIQAAYGLQHHLKENGLDAVKFMEEAENLARDEGRDVVVRNIERLV